MTGLRVEYLEKHRALSVILRSNSVMPEGVAKHICRRHGSALRVAFISLDYSEGPFSVEEFHRRHRFVEFLKVRIPAIFQASFQVDPANQ